MIICNTLLMFNKVNKRKLRSIRGHSQPYLKYNKYEKSIGLPVPKIVARKSFSCPIPDHFVISFV